MREEITSQAAHAAAALLALAPAAFWPNPITFAWAGFCLGMVREVTEESPLVTIISVRNAVQSYRDLAFWTLGGFVTGWIGA
jgi:lipid-binding SYLF domain-containing protein